MPFQLLDILENDEITAKSNTIDYERNLDDPPTTKMEIPPIHQLPIEMLVNIIKKIPRTQWPALELVDPKFQDAVLVAWSSVRNVNIERDFIYSESKTIKNESEKNSEMAKGRLRRQIAGKTESILKKLYERSPFITSIVGLSLIDDDSIDDPALNTTAIQYLAKFEHLKTIKFVWKYVSGRIVNGREVRFTCGIPLINFIEFIETTQSRATLNEIDMNQQSRIPDDPMMFAHFDHRLRAGFSNVSNDPTRQLLQLESLSMRICGPEPFTFCDTIDASRMKKLSLGYLNVDPTALTTLINRASQLQRLDFGFLSACNSYDLAAPCQEGRLQSNKELLAALGSHKQLTSLGFNRIWSGVVGCACQRFEAEFKKMLQAIAPRLVKFSFNLIWLPPIPMGEIRDIIQHMPQLKSISLDSSCAKNPEELRGIADGKELEEIVIDAGMYSDHRELLNEVMSTIISKSPRLKKFNGVNYCPDQRVVVELCKLSDLIDLRVQANRLTNEDFVAFSQQVFAEKLEILHLGRIGEGMEAGLIEFVGKTAQLRELDVDRNVSDKLLECLAKSCPNLEKFSVSWANGITFGGVQMLVDRCTKLRRLNVDGPLTIAALKNLKLDRYRKLEIEFF